MKTIISKQPQGHQDPKAFRYSKEAWDWTSDSDFKMGKYPIKGIDTPLRKYW